MNTFKNIKINFIVLLSKQTTAQVYFFQIKNTFLLLCTAITQPYDVYISAAQNAKCIYLTKYSPLAVI